MQKIIDNGRYEWYYIKTNICLLNAKFGFCVAID